MPTKDTLAQSLVEMQSEFQTIKNTATVKAGKFEYDYAPLPHILDVVRPLLHKHRFALSSSIDENLNLVVTLLHECGESRSSYHPLHKTSNPKELGSEITYMRRYGALALLGLATEDDDDGAGAAAGGARRGTSVAPPKRRAGTVAQLADGDLAGGKVQQIWIQLRKTELIVQASSDPEWSGENWLREKISKDFGKESTKTLTVDEANNIVAALKQIENDNAPPKE